MVSSPVTLVRPDVKKIAAMPQRATSNHSDSGIRLPMVASNAKGERQEKADRLRQLVEQDDVGDWLCKQLETIAKLGL